MSAMVPPVEPMQSPAGRVAKRSWKTLSWRRRGTLAAVLALAELVAALLVGCTPGSLVGAGRPTPASTTTTGMPTSSTPRATSEPLSQSKSFLEAWGLHAEIGSYSMNLDSTHRFVPTALSPDGSFLVGGAWVTDARTEVSTFQAGFLDLATHQFTAIGVSQGANPVWCCATDGRFLVAQDNSDSNIPNIGNARTWVYDRETRHLRLLAYGRTYNGLFGPGAISQGRLIVPTGDGMLLADLATGTMSAFPVSQPDRYMPISFSWPYLIYTPALNNNGDPLLVYRHDFATGQDGPFTALLDFGSAHESLMVSQSYLIIGDSVVATILAGPVVDATDEITSYNDSSIYVLDHVLSGGAGERELASFNDDFGTLVGGDFRLVVGANEVWDLALRTVISFPAYLQDGSTPESGILSYAGGYLAVAQGQFSNEKVLIFNTARLPLTSATG